MINWHSEIRKAKMFCLNAYCLKYVSLAEQILKERDILRSALENASRLSQGISFEESENIFIKIAEALHATSKNEND